MKIRKLVVSVADSKPFFLMLSLTLIAIMMVKLDLTQKLVEEYCSTTTHLVLD